MTTKSKIVYHNPITEQDMTKSEYSLFVKALQFQKKYFQDIEDVILMNVSEEARKFIPETSVNFYEWKFNVVDKNDNFTGECSGFWKVINIVPSRINNRILLHEMIHAYESMLSDYKIEHEYLIVKLYQKLLSKIPNIIEIIEVDIDRDNREHTVFFLLKSLDIDLELRLPIGSIYGYGREELYKK
ncbi:hypothetical protein FDA33_09970 [Clostridium botulinum]|uniref:Uncharacterized protein n=1 Tax=Clostridium botulinum TaxID=1491 RepID=A0A126JI00_CLOBO|nr:hypothetical protein [Clostridium botulinum]ALT05318.1 hypothetical protein [Clostridium botulinum]NFH90518.1 hypothetical protein [Clostridium botulinum]NFI19538.1 hypothetical protein [Clostridium botulinum]NFN06138.1 hypothetical protein [Clostridium botulinum]NFN19465.1 hypothetical protein [Clostridium botulinum]